ncbi:MAG: S9 family peptidase [Cyanobacteria bacterium TGS_CYA1]|nr:S9 family peptidase [Cyanobacteria bacterium TGS_CYA1]
MNQTESSNKRKVWQSPIGAQEIAGGSIKLQESQFGFKSANGSDPFVYWLETRPLEGGRNVVVRNDKHGAEDMFPQGYNARTLVHEYGGGAYAVLPECTVFGDAQEIIVFVNYKDQRLYLAASGKEPRALSCEGPWRYADLVFDKNRNRILCVMEILPEAGGEPQNVIAAVSLELDQNSVGNEPIVLYAGHDFFAFPRLNESGSLCAFIAWEHPNMPWDESRLFLADLNDPTREPEIVAGGVDNSVYQPLFAPDGTLFFVDEESGFWNIYKISAPETVFSSSSVEKKIPVVSMSAEFGLPLWVFADNTYALAEDEKSLYSVYCEKGLWFLSLLEFDNKKNHYTFCKIETPFTDMDYVSARGTDIVMIAGAPNMVRSVVKFDTRDKSFQILRSGSSLQIDKGFISIPQTIEFEGANKELAHAFFYPPQNKNVEVNNIDKPPLIVRSHGGPTSASDAVLNLTYQFWTSRGFAVVDVNYGGSTGFGRKYRNRLLKNWGIVDMLDCQGAAQYLCDKGLVDPKRLIIAGGSAGGYTTLCALTFCDTFTAGCSYYGIGDLKALMNDTHKFESRYLDSLIGPYPEAASLYFDRSPINFTNKLNCPVIFFQGLEDKVVPPSQAEQMVAALKDKKVTVAYLAYEGEQHGFRKAENIKRTMEAELYFYALIFDLDLKEKIEPISVNF